MSVKFKREKKSKNKKKSKGSTKKNKKDKKKERVKRPGEPRRKRSKGPEKGKEPQTLSAPVSACSAPSAPPKPPPLAPVRPAPPPPAARPPLPPPRPDPVPADGKIKEEPLEKPPVDDDMTIKQVKKQQRENKALTKIKKMFEWKWESAEDDFRNGLCRLPSAASRVAFDQNIELTRFEDVVCIDQTRVTLMDKSVFLHASWVHSGDNKRSIVAQLPLPVMAHSFWRMVAEHNVRAILLFMTEKEFEQFEASATFPAIRQTLWLEGGGSVSHVQSVQVNSRWILRVLFLQMGDVRRYVHLHHYMGWRHDGTMSIDHLWQLDSTFRKYGKTPPIFVDVSGVGRAAAFATLQMAHDALHDPSANSVNVMESLQLLRESRMHAVQCPTHMLTVHAALIKHVCDTPHLKKIKIVDSEKIEKLIAKCR